MVYYDWVSSVLPLFLEVLRVLLIQVLALFLTMWLEKGKEFCGNKTVPQSISYPGPKEHRYSSAQRAEDRRQKDNFCRLPFAVNVKLSLSNIPEYIPAILLPGVE